MKYLKKLNTNKAKAFLLAGLMGLTPSCKDDKNAPEDPKTQESTYSVPSSREVATDMPVDSFMTHMQNPDQAVFYEPIEDEWRFSFHTGNTDNVDNVTIIRDLKAGTRGIHNPYVLSRADNPSVNGGANFNAPMYWFFYVEYKNEYGGGGDWTIDAVTDQEYKDKYENMSLQELGDLAYNRLITQHPEDTYHAERIRDAILDRQGNWTQDEAFNMTFNSNGWKQNLKYSDFGTFVFMNSACFPVFTSMYSGGIADYEVVNKYMIQPQTFKATAYANVTASDRTMGSEQEIIVSTGRDSATLTIDAMQNETIVMPFKNWYTVTIIRTNNSVVSSFEDAAGTVTENWQVLHSNIPETGYREFVRDNGLSAKEGSYGEEHSDGFVTVTSVNYYTDETGYVEFVGQGCRHDWLPNRKNQFWFSFGGTNRPKTNENVTTGLQEVYCIPGRNNQR